MRRRSDPFARMERVFYSLENVSGSNTKRTASAFASKAYPHACYHKLTRFWHACIYAAAAQSFASTAFAFNLAAAVTTNTEDLASAGAGRVGGILWGLLGLLGVHVALDSSLDRELRHSSPPPLPASPQRSSPPPAPPPNSSPSIVLDGYACDDTGGVSASLPCG